MPQVVFGGSWLGLTYERFGLFASLTIFAFVWIGICVLNKETIWESLFGSLSSSLSFLCRVGNK